MTALIRDRNTPGRDAVDFVFPVAAGAVIHAGAMLAMSATGFARPAATATGLQGIGLGNVGKPCYMVDDQTVAKTDGTTGGAATRSPAGWVRDVDADGVWVEF
jgi:hypothetical protein